MRITKIHWKSFHTPIAISAAVFLGIIASTLAWPFMQAFMIQRAAMVEQLASVEDMKSETSVQNVVEDSVSETSPAPATELVPGQVEAGELVQRVADQFAGYTIAANVHNSSRQYYLIRDASGAVFTDAQLRSMGLRVYTVNECELMLTDAVDPANKAHVFAPGCTPSDGSKRRNLRELPYFANTRPLL